MNALKLFLTVMAAALLIAPAAFAQSSVAEAVFSAVEKRIIRDYYGVPATQQTPDDDAAPKWAVKDGDESARDSQDEDEDRDDADKKKDKDKGKDKNKKHKDKDKSKGLPPGLAKRDQLPPGLAKQLAEKGRLPPGLAKRDLPADLAAQLPARPKTQDVTLVEGDVVLVDKATGIILDVLKDVITNGTTPHADGTLAPPASQDDPGVTENLLDAVLQGVFGKGQ